MFVADIVLTKSFPLSIVPIKPFIYKGYTGFFTLRDEWTTCDDIYTEGRIEKVIQSAIDYSKMLKTVSSLVACEALEGSYYFDKPNQVVYIHTLHDCSTIASVYDYGFAFGVSTNGVQYINDDEYLPIVVSYPEIEIQDEAVGQSQPTGIVANVVLNNLEYTNDEGRREGVLDFLLNDGQSVYGNEIVLYNYDGATLETVVVATVNDFEISLQQVTLSLKDERMK